ncbi:MAG: helix-turn-helix domain-containing protein [Bacteroidales bacterium]|nr:helix-turn-helix domain-containing protein [Bacteroidales bacterium]
MEIVTIEKKAFERMMARFNELAEKVASLQRMTESGSKAVWLTGDEVCRQLRITPRTLQTYRDRRLIGFTQINRKFYYRQEEVGRFLTMVGNGYDKPINDKEYD